MDVLNLNSIINHCIGTENDSKQKRSVTYNTYYILCLKIFCQLQKQKNRGVKVGMIYILYLIIIKIYSDVKTITILYYN
jgi:hypothetical protein